MARMNRLEYDKKIQQLIDDIKSQNFSFPDDNAEKQLNRKTRALYSFKFFKHTYFPHYVTLPSGKFHSAIHQLTNLMNTIIGIAGPHGHGKTVDIAVIDAIWRALRHDHEFQIIIGGNQETAAERNAAIRYEFTFNQNIIHDFGQQLTEFQGTDEKFTIKEGCRFLALGYGQAVRGKLFRSKRPTRILVDDYEDDKSRNPKIGREKLEYIMGDCAGAFGPEGGIVLWLGNLTSANSAFALFKKRCDNEPDNDQILFNLYKAIQDDGTALWPEGYSLEKLEKERQKIGTIAFERHYQQNPVIEGIRFKSNWFTYYGRYSIQAREFERIITYCDPIKSNKGNTCMIVTLGFYEHKMYILKLHLRQSSINDMIHELYYRDKEYPTGRIYMERTLQQFLWEFIPPFEEEFGYILGVNGIENAIAKELRIEKLEPIFQNGWMVFYDPKDPDQIMLEEQLLTYPDHPDDDGPDGLAAAVEILKHISEKQEYRGQARKSNDFHRMH
jgi:hypothetical protein